MGCPLLLAKRGGIKKPELQGFELGLERRRGVDCTRKMGRAASGAGGWAASWLEWSGNLPRGCEAGAGLRRVGSRWRAEKVVREVSLRGEGWGRGATDGVKAEKAEVHQRLLRA